MNFLTLATSSGASGSGAASGCAGMTQNPIFLIIIVAVFVLMFVLTSIPQRKKKKQMQEMLAQLKPGDQIKTIGGMVGTITAVNDMTGMLTINVGTADAPTYINIDRVAIYTVAPAPTAAPVVEVAPADDKEEDK